MKIIIYHYCYLLIKLLGLFLCFNYVQYMDLFRHFGL